MIQTIQIAPPDDWHLHLRDGEALEHVVAATALNFRRAIVMPNLKPPVTTVDQAVAYRQRILDAVEKACLTGDYSVQDQDVMRQFEPLMVLYLTGATSPQEIEKAAGSGVVKAVKLYPAGATTNSEAGVSDLLGQCGAVLQLTLQYGERRQLRQGGKITTNPGEIRCGIPAGRQPVTPAFYGLVNVGQGYSTAYQAQFNPADIGIQQGAGVTAQLRGV